MRPAARWLLGGRLRAAAFAARARAMVIPAAAAAATAPTPARLPIAPHADPLAAFPRRVAALPRRVSPACARHVGGIPLSPSRRVTHPHARRGVAASAAADTSDAALESNAGSTLSEHARGSGVVVTSQANFLRVVVERGSLTPEARRERALQFARAANRARAAGHEHDAERLEARAADEGPYELLCVVRALLKKIKQRVLVVRPPLPSGKTDGPRGRIREATRPIRAPSPDPESTPRIGAPSSRSFLAFLPHFIT